MMAERRNLAMFTEKILLLVNREGSADAIHCLLPLKFTLTMLLANKPCSLRQ